MCDIKDCRKESTHHLEVLVAYYQIEETGGEIYTEKDVDLCGTHYYDYKTSLPGIDFRVERKESTV
jgi:hypothetical protein